MKILDHALNTKAMLSKACNGHKDKDDDKI